MSSSTFSADVDLALVRRRQASAAATMSAAQQVALAGDGDRLGHGEGREEPRLLERPAQPALRPARAGRRSVTSSP